MDKYTIAPPAGSTQNSVGASDRPWHEGHFNSIKLNGGDLGEYLAESTGYGIVSGCQATVNGLIVTISDGVVHSAKGKRIEIEATEIALSTASSSKSKMNLIYINSDGEIVKLTGAEGNPSVPFQRPFNLTTNFAVGDRFSLNGKIFTATSDLEDENHFIVGSNAVDTCTNIVKSLKKNQRINDLFAVSSSSNTITITEKNAGHGDQAYIGCEGTGHFDFTYTQSDISSTSEIPSLPDGAIFICCIEVGESDVVSADYTDSVERGTLSKKFSKLVAGLESSSIDYQLFIALKEMNMLKQAGFKDVIFLIQPKVEGNNIVSTCPLNKLTSLANIYMSNGFNIRSIKVHMADGWNSSDASEVAIFTSRYKAFINRDIIPFALAVKAEIITAFNESDSYIVNHYNDVKDVADAIHSNGIKFSITNRDNMYKSTYLDFENDNCDTFCQNLYIAAVSNASVRHPRPIEIAECININQATSQYMRYSNDLIISEWGTCAKWNYLFNPAYYFNVDGIYTFDVFREYMDGLLNSDVYQNVKEVWLFYLEQYYRVNDFREEFIKYFTES